MSGHCQSEWLRPQNSAPFSNSPRDGKRAIKVPIKLLVVEDHPVVRDGIRMLLDGQREVDIVGEAGTAADAVRLADAHQPDVVLMDIGLPDSSGFDASAVIKRRHPGMAIVALTMHEDQEYIDRMLANGASAYIRKRAAPSELLIAIRRAARLQGRSVQGDRHPIGDLASSGIPVGFNHIP